jgi:hypothetical protein
LAVEHYSLGCEYFLIFTGVVNTSYPPTSTNHSMKFDSSSLIQRIHDISENEVLRKELIKLVNRANDLSPSDHQYWLNKFAELENRFDMPSEIVKQLDILADQINSEKKLNANAEVQKRQIENEKRQEDILNRIWPESDLESTTAKSPNFEHSMVWKMVILRFSERELEKNYAWTKIGIVQNLPDSFLVDTTLDLFGDVHHLFSARDAYPSSYWVKGRDIYPKFKKLRDQYRRISKMSNAEIAAWARRSLESFLIELNG